MSRSALHLALSLATAASLGALAVASIAHARTTGAPSAPVTATWSYLCFEGANAKEVMEKANHAGARGWELVAASPGENRSSVWCFRQARWARPSAPE